MNLADQIESIARRATAEVTAASHRFTQTQQRLAEDLAEYRSEHGPDGERDADNAHRDDGGGYGDPERSGNGYYDGEPVRRSAHGTDDRVREDLRRHAEDADVATPRVMLPAHLADASPHSPAAEDLPSTRDDGRA